MEGIKWRYSRKFVKEYGMLTESFIHLFQHSFDKEITVPFALPNYIAIRADSPQGSNGVRCFELKDGEFLINIYPEICCSEMLEDEIRNMPTNVREAVVDFSTYDCARWALGGLMLFSVGMSNKRLINEFKTIDDKYITDVWQFVLNIKDSYVHHLASQIENVIVTQKSLAFGIMDFDTEFLIPYVS